VALLNRGRESYTLIGSIAFSAGLIILDIDRTVIGTIEDDLTMARRVIEPKNLADTTQHHFSPAIVADGTFYISGQVGTDEHGNYVGDDIESQTRQAFENVGTILQNVNRDFEDVIKITSYIVDIRDHYEAFQTVYREVFSTEPFPCHTAIGVESLASETPLVELEIEVPIDKEQ
jgi:2-iminobutanoate/2-iminopropanoate deaminase